MEKDTTAEVVRMINDRTSEMYDQYFDDPLDANQFENHLEMMFVHFQRWSNGKLIYECIDGHYKWEE